MQNCLSSTANFIINLANQFKVYPRLFPLDLDTADAFGVGIKDSDL
jgi:hypothetical protein